MTSGTNESNQWVEDLELQDVQIKWSFSHMDGRADIYNDEGDHNFTIILDPADAVRLGEIGWAVKENPPYEEGDEPEFHLKAKISYRFDPPRIFLIKRGRKIRAEQRDLADIRRNTCDRLDVVLTPSRWVNGQRSGITAYVKEMYAVVKTSEISDMYADLEEV